MNTSLHRLRGALALLSLSLGAASAVNLQVGANLPTSLASIEAEFELDGQSALGVGVGLFGFVDLGTIPAANVYYRSFPGGTTRGGLFYGGRLGSNLLLTPITAVAGYRIDLGGLYLDGEIGVGAMYFFGGGLQPTISIGANLGVRF